MKQLLLIIFSFMAMGATAQSLITWSPGQNIAASSFGNLHPRIVTDAAGNPLVIWGRMSDQSVFFSRWNGTAFTMPVKLNPGALTIATASWMGPDIASKGDTIYIVMKQTPENVDSSYIYIVNSYDGGMNFSDTSRVDFIADSISRFPTLTVDATGNPVVGFMKFNSSFLEARWVVTRSVDFGNTFSPDVLASGWSGGVVCDCCPGALVCSGNTAAMLYRDNLNDLRDVWTGLSIDGGNSFTQGFDVDNGNWMLGACPSSGPDAVIVGDSLFTVYMSGSTGTVLVYYSLASISASASTTGTEITGPVVGLTSQNYPRIASSENAIVVAWKQRINNIDQLLVGFTNDITTGWPSVFDTVDFNDITNSDVALINGKIYIVWQDDNSGTVKYRSGTFAPATTSIQQIQDPGLLIFPNPVSDKFQLMNYGLKNTIEFDLYNSIGQIVLRKNSVGQGEKVIDLSELQKGIYFLRVISKEDTPLIKVMRN